MKKLCIFILVVLLALPAIPVSASAENVMYDIYDAQSLSTYLQTEGADLILWNDITIYWGSASCHSIDLNGYNLTITYGLTSTSDDFVLMDSLYSSDGETSGKLTVNETLSMNNLTIENGYIEINGGITGTGELKILDGTVTVNGTNGEKGSDGKDGRSYSPNSLAVYNGGDGGDGSDGTNGSSGTTGITVNSLVMSGGALDVAGGDGGDGGNGGDGGDGQNAEYTHIGGDGGDGGDGGRGGNGGHGIVAEQVVISGGSLNTCGGKLGLGGSGGARGSRGNSGKYADEYGVSGVAGSNGGYGYGGCGIYADSVTVNGGSLSATGSSRDTVEYYGGAGIHGDLAVYQGTVTAVAGYNGAGIGGTGYYSDYNGGNVKIYGGTVSAQGGGNGFDIGGGYSGLTVGTPGTLEVTGGTLILNTYGRATNVSGIVFRNCVVEGPGAYQHEGTYNENGKFTVEVTDLAIAPEDYEENDTVVLTADLSISRTSNITTPAPRGSISFKADGQEVATAKITNATVSDGFITATATANWTVAKDVKELTAEYVSGTNDKYAPENIYTAAVTPTHIHEWNDEFTVDVQPTCTNPGMKSIHCKTCDEQKDYAEVPALGHSYQAVVTPPTITAEGYTTHTCTVCGNSYKDSYTDPIKPELPSVNLRFASAYLSLESDLSVIFQVKSEVLAEYDDVTLTFKVGENGQEQVFSEEEYFIGQSSRPSYKVTGVAPRQVSETIYASLRGYHDGVEYTYSMEYSAGKYCYSTLRNNTSSAELKTLIVELLNYAAAHQVYGSTNLDNMANASLTDAEKALSTTAIPTMTSCQNSKYVTHAAPTAKFRNAALYLEDAVTIRCLLNLNTGIDVNQVTVNITDDAGNTWTVPGTELENAGSNNYYLNFKDLSAQQMRKVIYLTICENGVAISHTLRYSIESYAAAKYTASDSFDELKDLLLTMMRYGDAAKAYFESK